MESWRERSASLHAAVEAASETALSTVSGSDALAYLADLQIVRTKLDALIARTLANPGGAALVMGETGRRSVAALVAAETKTNPRTARTQQNLGLWLNDYAEFAAAFADGRISSEHLSAIRASENQRSRPFMSAAQGHLIEAAETCQWTEFVAVLRYWELAADPDGEEPEEQRSARSCNYRKHNDGSLSGRFNLDPLGGRAFMDALERETQRLFRCDAEQGSSRTTSQRRADALVGLITTGGGTRRVSSPLVHVVMSERVAAGHFARGESSLRHDDVDGRCEFSDGTPLHPHLALAAMATAQFRRLVLDPESERLDLGRSVRGFPEHLKQALLVRARGRCQQPGCDAPVHWMQADHLIPWSRGGDTSIVNGQILCDPHNKLKRDQLPPGRPPRE